MPFLIDLRHCFSYSMVVVGKHFTFLLFAVECLKFAPSNGIQDKYPAEAAEAAFDFCPEGGTEKVVVSLQNIHMKTSSPFPPLCVPAACLLFVSSSYFFWGEGGPAESEGVGSLLSLLGILSVDSEAGLFSDAGRVCEKMAEQPVYSFLDDGRQRSAWRKAGPFPRPVVGKELGFKLGER